MPGAFTIGHNVNSNTEVDQVMTFYGGYAGYFRDIDGHLWEMVWKPFFIRGGIRCLDRRISKFSFRYFKVLLRIFQSLASDISKFMYI